MSQNSKKPLSILQVSALDRGGGAEQIAWNLFQAYRHLGITSWLAVGKKRSNDANVIVIDESSSRTWWSSACNQFADALNPMAGRVRGILRLQALLRNIAAGKDWLANVRGEENFHFPGSWHVLEQFPQAPSILHLHNLHGGYFDPRALTKLSSEVPVMLTLHDAWLLSGNCAHSFQCDRWKTGCGNCPDISIYPGLKKDSTHANWLRKKEIFDQSKLYIATPCQWLMDKVNESIIAPAMIEGRVIYNGVDTNIFHPGDKCQARLELGLPANEPILLFVANGIKNNPFKDYETLRKSIELLGSQSQTPIHLVALGESGQPESIGNVLIHYIPRTTQMELVAKYYQAADLYLHASKAETFPNTILEAMACGLPVIATSVGGIPEQVDDGITGFLVSSNQSELMASATKQLLDDIDLRKKMGLAAIQKVHKQFTLEWQTKKYIEWYESILRV